MTRYEDELVVKILEKIVAKRPWELRACQWCGQPVDFKSHTDECPVTLVSLLGKSFRMEGMAK